MDEFKDTLKKIEQHKEAQKNNALQASMMWGERDIRDMNDTTKRLTGIYADETTAKQQCEQGKDSDKKIIGKALSVTFDNIELGKTTTDIEFQIVEESGQQIIKQDSYEVGDEVLLRTWEDIVAEFGFDNHVPKYIDFGSCILSLNDDGPCLGEIQKIKSIDADNDFKIIGHSFWLPFESIAGKVIEPDISTTDSSLLPFKKESNT